MAGSLVCANATIANRHRHCSNDKPDSSPARKQSDHLYKSLMCPLHIYQSVCPSSHAPQTAGGTKTPLRKNSRET